MRFNKKMLILAIIFGAALRLISLYRAGSFWFDETFTLYFARLPWNEAWQYLQFENNPPLHFFLARSFVMLFGQNEFLLRLTSVLASVATIPVIYLLGKKIHSRSAGLIAASLFAVSGLSIFHAVEFRSYPWLILFTALSIYYFLEYLEFKKRITLLVLVAVNTLLLLTQLTASVVLVVEAGYILWRRRTLLGQWCLYQTIPVTAFLVWWLPSFLNRSVGDVANSWFFSLKFDPLYFFEQFYAFLVFPSPFPSWLIACLGLSICAFIIRGLIKSIYIKEEHHLIFILSLLIVPVTLGFILNVQIPKQYSISLVPFVLILGIAGASLIEKRRLRLPIIFLVIICLAALNYPALWRKPYTLDKLVQAIEQESGPKTEILAAAHIYTLPLELYYHGNLPVKPIYFGEDSADNRMRLVRHNWHINYYSKEQLDHFLNIEAKLYTTILVVGTTNWQREGDIVRLWFMTHGWRLARTYSWEGYFNPDLHVFKKMMK